MLHGFTHMWTLGVCVCGCVYTCVMKGVNETGKKDFR